MVLEAGDRDLPLLDPDDPLDDADVELRRIQRAALLDVQLEVAGDIPLLALHLIELCRIAADESNPLLNRLPAVRNGFELGSRELAAHRATAEQTALLILPDYDLQRMASRDVVLGQRLSDL